ncbi:hypothetical protein D3C76_941290 [compost metagenome]
MFRVCQVIGIGAGHCMLPGNDQFAVGQFLFHQEPWQQRHPAADLRRADAHVEGFETRAVVAVFGVVALTVEPVVPGLGAGGVLQQDQVGELRRVGERRVGEAAWCTHRHKLFTE